jgi:methionine sulfoxide reductase heme-binding subunit
MATPRRSPGCIAVWTSGAISEFPRVSDARAPRRLPAVWLKPLVWIGCGLPLGWLAWAVAVEVGSPGAVLGADPGEAVVHHLGEWGLRILLLALAVTPLRRRLAWPDLARVRRLIGLFAFAYLALHFLAYLTFLAAFDWASIVEDLTRRTYLIAGATGLLALIPLAVTSTRGWQRRLGRRWRTLHRLVYVACGLGLAHLWWLTKDGYGEVLAYTVVYLLLMAERLERFASRRTRDERSGQSIL